jgi:hypothetical protein
VAQAAKSQAASAEELQAVKRELHGARQTIIEQGARARLLETAVAERAPVRPVRALPRTSCGRPSCALAGAMGAEECEAVGSSRPQAASRRAVWRCDTVVLRCNRRKGKRTRGEQPCGRCESLGPRIGRRLASSFVRPKASHAFG